MIRRTITALLSITATTLAQGNAGGDQSTCSASQRWVSRGCYDNANNGVHIGFTWKLSSIVGNENYYPGFNGLMTVDICLSACRGHGFRYAALYAGSNCYCASTFPNPAPLSSGVTTSGVGTAPGGAPGTPGGRCNTPCNGNTTQICGGAISTKLYEDPSFNSSAPRAASNYLYIGCFTNVGPGPMFTTIKTVSTNSCETYCGQLGFSYSSRSGVDSNTGANTCGCGSEIQTGLEIAGGNCSNYCNGTLNAQ